MRINLARLHDWRTGDDVPVLRIEPITRDSHNAIAIVDLQGGEQTVVQVGSTNWTFCASDWKRRWTADEVLDGLANDWAALPPWVDSSDGAVAVVKEKDGSRYVTWADDDIRKAKVKAWMEGARESMRPAVERLAEVDRYHISDRKGLYVSEMLESGLYRFTRDVKEAAVFDRLSAITQPIVDAQSSPSFYFDPAKDEP